MTSYADGGLLSCPFCESGRLENLDDKAGQVRCIDCGARGPLPPRLEAYLGFDIHDNYDAWMVRDGEKYL